MIILCSISGLIFAVSCGRDGVTGGRRRIPPGGAHGADVGELTLPTRKNSKKRKKHLTIAFTCGIIGSAKGSKRLYRLMLRMKGDKRGGQIGLGSAKFDRCQGENHGE